MATQKKSPLLSRFTWFLGFLGWIPAHSSAASTEAYPPIDSSIISSANYEIRRLLCPDCGSVSDVVYLPERESFFVSTFQGDLWKIRSEEHTSELQSRPHLVCRLLLEKKKNIRAV